MARMTADRRRAAIVDAALAVARRKGLAGTTVRDVAQAMDSSSGLVHHYFTTMDEVLAAAFERVAGEDLARTTEAVASADGQVARLAAFLGSYAPADADWAFQLWLDAWAEAARRPALRATSQRLNLAWHRLVAGIIREGEAAGEPKVADPDAAAWRVISVIDGLALQVVAHDGLISRTEMLAWAAEAVERELGLAAGALAAESPGDRSSARPRQVSMAPPPSRR